MRNRISVRLARKTEGMKKRLGRIWIAWFEVKKMFKQENKRSDINAG